MGKKKPLHIQRTEKLLGKYTFMKIGLENMQIELKAARMNDGVGSADPGKENFKTNKFHSSVESAVINNLYSRRIERLEERIDISKNQISKINRILDELKDEEKKIIRLYYIEGKQWYEVAEIMNYSEKWCGKIRNDALEKISIALGYSLAAECKVISEKIAQ